MNRSKKPRRRTSSLSSDPWGTLLSYLVRAVERGEADQEKYARLLGKDTYLRCLCEHVVVCRRYNNFMEKLLPRRPQINRGGNDAIRQQGSRNPD